MTSHGVEGFIVTSELVKKLTSIHDAAISPSLARAVKLSAPNFAGLNANPNSQACLHKLQSQKIVAVHVAEHMVGIVREHVGSVLANARMPICQT